MIPEYLYRYEDVAYGSLDEFENLLPPRYAVEQRKYEVIKETPCGYWIRLFSMTHDKKWVSKVAKKRFAYPTTFEAIYSFKARKKRQIQILEAQLQRAKFALIEVEGLTSERLVVLKDFE